MSYLRFGIVLLTLFILSDSFSLVLAQSMYKFKGKRFDCGSVDGFIEATNYFYEKCK